MLQTKVVDPNDICIFIFCKNFLFGERGASCSAFYTLF